jgi:hypothetical protein
LYQQSDLQENRRQLKRRLTALLIPLALIVAGIVISLIVRMQWLTILLTILGGGFSIFCWGLLLSPIMCYGRHLRNMLEGRTRETTGRFVSISGEPCWREGVQYYAMTVNVGEKGDEADDRLFYYDVHKEAPAFKQGERITVVSHDKAVANVLREA